MGKGVAITPFGNRVRLNYQRLCNKRRLTKPLTMQNSLSLMETPILIPVYFKSLGQTKEITFRRFDRWLHEFMIANVNGQWVTD